MAVEPKDRRAALALEAGQVAAGAERIAAAGHDDRAHLRRRGRIEERLGQLLLKLLVERVTLLRAIQTQQQDAVRQTLLNVLCGTHRRITSNGLRQARQIYCDTIRCEPITPTRSTRVDSHQGQLIVSARTVFTSLATEETESTEIRSRCSTSVSCACSVAALSWCSGAAGGAGRSRRSRAAVRRSILLSPDRGAAMSGFWLRLATAPPD